MVSDIWVIGRNFGGQTYCNFSRNNQNLKTFRTQARVLAIVKLITICEFRHLTKRSRLKKTQNYQNIIYYSNTACTRHSHENDKATSTYNCDTTEPYYWYTKLMTTSCTKAKYSGT